MTDQEEEVFKRLLEAARTLIESVHHAYNCPELKEGLSCNCGFHEAVSTGAKAIAQAEEPVQGERMTDDEISLWRTLMRKIILQEPLTKEEIERLKELEGIFNKNF